MTARKKRPTERRVISIPPDHPGFDKMASKDALYDPRCEWSHYHDVGSGAWVYIAKEPPVSKKAAPKRHNIYWAVPARSVCSVEYIDWDNGGMPTRLTGEVIGRDQYRRQAVIVLTCEEVTLFTDEYSVIPDEKLERLRAEGYEMVPVNAHDEPVDMRHIERGRSLVEEEREIIWALMLDGLSESAACGEYFFERHIDPSNRGMYYRPNPALREEIESIFGD